jgi:hypothetical protein
MIECMLYLLIFLIFSVFSIIAGTLVFVLGFPIQKAFVESFSATNAIITQRWLFEKIFKK